MDFSPPVWLFTELPVVLCDSESNVLMIPLENPFPMLKPAGMRKRKNKWHEGDGFSIFIPPTGAVSEVVQELRETSAEVSRTSVQ